MPKGNTIGTGVMLRDWLIKNKKGSPYEFYNYMRNNGEMARKGYHIANYQSVRTLFYMLSNKLHIIKVVSREERNGRIITYYAIEKGHEYDESWKAIYRSSYPDMYRVKDVKN